MDMMVSRWIDIGALDDIPRRGARVVKTPAGCIAVFRTEADEIYALDDRCPHKGGPLSQGIVHGRSVTCRPARPRRPTRDASPPYRCAARAGACCSTSPAWPATRREAVGVGVGICPTDSR